MSASDQNTAFGIRIACPDCGGALVYDIEAASMRCLNCGNLTLDDDSYEPSSEFLLPGQKMYVGCLGHRVDRDHSRDVTPDLK